MLNQLIATGTVAAAAEESGSADLALIIGGAIMALFLVMLLITVSFSNRGLGHAPHSEVADPHRQHPNKHGHH
ncbi:hypothetical protein [Zhihengliuella sp.]|uniref:hypothetical protein n=1 Tax=Zhihengliuella sp. TaxID=1954483 RepID=UPI002811EA13|nr:hypothetical protein [Zhihengliuella sp.]